MSGAIPGQASAGATIGLARQAVKRIRFDDYGFVKEHNGHHEEIVGVLKPAQKSGAAIKEKRGKKTRVSMQDVRARRATRVELMVALREG